jgi:hypothetical protein
VPLPGLQGYSSAFTRTEQCLYKGLCSAITRTDQRLCKDSAVQTTGEHVIHHVVNILQTDKQATCYHMLLHQGLRGAFTRRYTDFSSAFPAQQRGRYMHLAVPLKDLALHNNRGTCYQHVVNMFQAGYIVSACYSHQGLSSAFPGMSRT